MSPGSARLGCSRQSFVHLEAARTDDTLMTGSFVKVESRNVVGIGQASLSGPRRGGKVHILPAHSGLARAVIVDGLGLFVGLRHIASQAPERIHERLLSHQMCDVALQDDSHSAIASFGFAWFVTRVCVECRWFKNTGQGRDSPAAM